MKKLVTRLSIVFLANTITCLFLIQKTQAQCTADTTIVFDTICLGDSSLINGFYRKIPGMYYDTLTNSSACDSFIFTHLISKGFAPETFGSEFYDGDFESWYNEPTTCDTNNSMNIKFPMLMGKALRKLIYFPSWAMEENLGSQRNSAAS